MIRRLGLFLSPAAAVLLYLLLPEAGDGGLSEAGRATAAAAVLMAGWWLTEALPLPATSLVPVALFPLIGAGSIKQAAAPYAHKLIFLFMGGFMIAAAMERWGLHRRVALTAVEKVGTRPDGIVAAFMGVTAFLSMWVSNTATALMMLSIGTSVVALVGRRGGSPETRENFAVCLALGIAYSASIGGIGTLIGTPPNALLAAFVEQEYGRSLSFGGWMLVGMPFTAALLPITWWLLTRRLFPVGRQRVPGGRKLMREELAKLGPMKPAETAVLIVFSCVAAAWMTRPLLRSLFPEVFGSLNDAGIAMLGVLALFLLPAGPGRKDEAGERRRVLDWETAVKIPWGVLLLFGGGLSLASAISRNGVAEFLGRMFSGLEGVGVLWLVLLAALLIVFLTELTSNTATTAAFLPIFAAVAVGVGTHPYMLLFPVAVGASCAFMMPVATPPNAIVFASGHVTMRQMFRAGIWLNVIAVALITLLIGLFGGALLGV